MLNSNNLFSLKVLNSKLEKLKFENEGLNIFFEDGIENNSLLEIAGEAGSGKSNLCMLMMLQTALPTNRNGLDSNVLYLTTVKKLSEKRLEQIVDSLNLTNIERKILMSKIQINNIEASEFDNFMLRLEEEIFTKKLKMIIVDSVAGLCDVQFINENNEVDYVGRAIFLKRILNQFKQLIHNYNLFFIVTNNVKADIERESGKNVPALGLIWENGVNTRILLHKNPKRKIEIIFSIYLDSKSCEFEITDTGINLKNY